jgi:hypothetical protein
MHQKIGHIKIIKSGWEQGMDPWSTDHTLLSIFPELANIDPLFESTYLRGERLMD